MATRHTWKRLARAHPDLPDDVWRIVIDLVAEMCFPRTRMKYVDGDGQLATRHRVDPTYGVLMARLARTNRRFSALVRENRLVTAASWVLPAIHGPGCARRYAITRATQCEGKPLPQTLISRLPCHDQQEATHWEFAPPDAVEGPLAPGTIAVYATINFTERDKHQRVDADGAPFDRPESFVVHWRPRLPGPDGRPLCVVVIGECWKYSRQPVTVAPCGSEAMRKRAIQPCRHEACLVASCPHKMPPSPHAPNGQVGWRMLRSSGGHRDTRSIGVVWSVTLMLWWRPPPSAWPSVGTRAH